MHVAKEMQRLAMTTPLLIGGATTSRAHTAIKIEPNYGGATIHVVDASRAVGVAGHLLSDENKQRLIDKTREDYTALRELHQHKKSANALIPLTAARENKFKVDWQTYQTPKPLFIGTRVFHDYPLDVLVN